MMHSIKIIITFILTLGLLTLYTGCGGGGGSSSGGTAQQASSSVTPPTEPNLKDNTPPSTPSL